MKFLAMMTLSLVFSFAALGEAFEASEYQKVILTKSAGFRYYSNGKDSPNRVFVYSRGEWSDFSIYLDKEIEVGKYISYKGTTLLISDFRIVRELEALDPKKVYECLAIYRIRSSDFSDRSIFAQLYDVKGCKESNIFE